ncbi:MAG TPA: glycogen debranching protein GlgX [Myxococcaceae bacterium]|nr:glycogen debranching protein GlgX [Myxococcaceae bacterium]
MTNAQVRPGVPYPLGATFTGDGVNFAVASERATGMDVCIFDPEDPRKQVLRGPLLEHTQKVWHGFVPGLGPGTLYGFRAHGAYEPHRGLRFNPAKLLVDPYARAIHGKVDFKGPVYPYRKDGKEGDLALDDQDDAAFKPKSVVVENNFDWKGVGKPAIPWHRSLIYEVHVKGFTMRHPGVPPELRGTYAGFGQPAVLEHLKKLGVTAVELLPVHEASDETFLLDKGLSNFWGYSTLGYFAPDQRFARSGSRGGQVNEFKWLVKVLHEHGIEVILDVVYNHTCEGNHMGPLLSWRGLDNTSYYHLKPDEPRYYMDFTGCGNSLNAGNPLALRMVMDSLRYWAEEMQVDGFRFDLATTLARPRKDFDRFAPFLQMVYQDPVLSKLKLIAEPWDVSEGGYQVGGFPVPFAEWNGKYRDAIRRYWKGEDSVAAEIGYRLSGSSDLFKLSGRRPWASINFVTAHDGFTLHDLVTYDQKHNEANGEENRDGANDNNSWNHGVEGETKDLKINLLREQQKRNFLTTLFISRGVPMLLAGDELDHTQGGNNNAYCQDNGLSWIDWAVDGRRQALFEFVCKLSRLRREQPVLVQQRFASGKQIWDSGLKDLAWFRPDGSEMSKEDWQRPLLRSLGFLLGGDAIPSLDPDGRRIVGDTLLVVMNAHDEPVSFTLPAIEWGADWELLVDTAAASRELFREEDLAELARAEAAAAAKAAAQKQALAAAAKAAAAAAAGSAAPLAAKPEAPAEPLEEPGDAFEPGKKTKAGGRVEVAARAMVVLRRPARD